MSKVNTFLQWFFWFAYASFLLASIPHVAYFFRAFEIHNDGQDLIWWIVAYVIALSIDVTVFLLSVSVANMHRAHKSTGLILSVWAMIVALTAFSWFMNYKYATHFASTTMLSPTPLTIPWLGTIHDVNPLLASMFQVLAVAYTWIADKIVSDEKPKTAAELKADADELAQVLTERKRMAVMKRAMKEETGGLIGNIGSTIRRAKREASSIISEGKEAGSPDSNDEQSAGPVVTWNEQGKMNTVQFPGRDPVFVHGQNDERIDANETTKTGGKIEMRPGNDASASSFAQPGRKEVPAEPDGQTAPQIALTPELLPVLNAYPRLMAILSTSRKTATVDEVSDALMVSTRLVTNRLKDGTLKHASRNDKLILLPSILDWAKVLLSASQHGSKTRVLPAVKPLQNGHHTESITDLVEDVVAE